MGQHDIDPVARPYDPATAQAKGQVDPAALFSLDVRVGEVTHVEAFPEARKPAWKVTVDFGPHVGSLVTSAQITNYSAQDLLGRTVVGVVNLPAKKIAGFTSQFLILAGLEADGTCRLLAPDADLPPGSVVA